jgi:hypothetical protein
MEIKNTQFKLLINSLFDNIYVLNLEKSSDRREHINNEFKRVGIENYEFFKATPHDSPEVYELINTKIKENMIQNIRNILLSKKIKTKLDLAEMVEDEEE